jgi:hypothetical protein
MALETPRGRTNRFGGFRGTGGGSEGANLRGGLIVLIVDCYGFKVFRLEYLIAIQTSDIIDPVTPRQNLGSGMLANLHT